MYATEAQATKLRAAVKAIKAHPDSFDMSHWACGTTCCLAGQVVRNATQAREWDQLVEEEMQARHAAEGYPIRDRALMELGIDWKGWTYGDGPKLFFVSDWPQDIQNNIIDRDEDGELMPTPEQLEERVERWIATGE